MCGGGGGLGRDRLPERIPAVLTAHTGPQAAAGSTYYALHAGGNITEAAPHPHPTTTTPDTPLKEPSSPF